MDASSKHSSSAATASLCFSHIQELWARLAWPDPAQAQALGTQLSQVGTAAQEEARALLHFWGAAGQRHMASSPELRLLPQDLCEAAVFYSELLRKKVDAQPGAAGEAVSEPVSRRPVGGGWGWGQEARRGPPPPATAAGTPPQLCTVLNDVELLRKTAGQALRGLVWPEGAAGSDGVLPRPLLSCTQALEEDLQREARTVTAHLTSKVGRGCGAGTWLPPPLSAPGAERPPPSDGERHQEVRAARQPVSRLHPERRGERPAS